MLIQLSRKTLADVLDKIGIEAKLEVSQKEQ